jgi:hypothetical protein
LANPNRPIRADMTVELYLPNLDCGTKLDWQEWLVSLDRIARAVD